ncbi:prepilin-type N-terminal cleavage/methylation domain-containing protein [Planctomicrobium sp. SH661]|uniref:PulJ/GspJ family protein n=1 Tax=Planctomicrobium sp. SH661 TaxID=3448124 RepID=UPI003F5B6A59
MKSAHRPSGFTLIEVLIALGLSVMLISAVYASVDLYYRYQTAGRAEIRGQQLMRALTRMIAQDLSCVVLKIPEEANSGDSGLQAADEAGAESSSGTGGASFSGSSFDAMAAGGTSSAQGSLSSGTEMSFLGLEDAGLPVIFGIVGTSELLHLAVSLPTRELNYFPLSTTTTPRERSSDLQIVTFGLTSIDSIQMAMLQKNLKSTRPSVGLGRRVRDMYTSIAGDEMLESDALIAPEVTELTFRYFDAGEWFESWDSVTMGRLPRAIEVDFGFWNPPIVQVGRSLSRESGTVTHVQYIFKVPLSAPTVQ